jgi:hypothetical protein
LCRSGYKTVQYLQNRYPSNKFNGRFDLLRHSTIDGWFDDNHNLKPEYQEKFNDYGESTNPRNAGAKSKLFPYPELEKEIINRLIKTRETGVVMRIRNIRIIMRALIQKHQPQLLEEFKLSKRWISTFVRSKLNWRTRRKTTAASKLPKQITSSRCCIKLFVQVRN